MGCRSPSRSRVDAAWTRRSRGLPPPTAPHLRLLWAESLAAVVPASFSKKTVDAERLRVLLDADLTSWDAWNQFGREFAEAAGARVVEIDDGGITGRGFHDHCRRLNKPVLQSPKRHRASLPPGLRTRSIRDPTPIWCWSLVTRADDATAPTCSRCATSPRSWARLSTAPRCATTRRRGSRERTAPRRDHGLTVT
jgi:hypothetical protein